MKKLIFLLKRKAGWTREDFRAYYEASHVVLAQKHLGHLLLDYRRSYVSEVSAIPTDNDGKDSPRFPFDYDVVTEMILRDADSLAEWMRIVSDPVIGAEFIADEHKFLDRDAVVMITCDEMTTGTAPPDAA